MYWPGTGQISKALTAETPRVVDVRPGGLTRARLTDLEGNFLMIAWLPPRARVVRRGDRIFLHRDGDEWRQLPVVEVDNGGMPMR